jgi:hypothetical protein
MNCAVSYELAQRAVRYVQNHHLKNVDVIHFDNEEEMIIYFDKSQSIVAMSEYNPKRTFGK